MGSGTFRIMTWNIHGSARPDMDRVISVVAGVAPDIIGVQEIRRRQCELLARQLRYEHRWDAKHNAYAPLPFTTEGLAVLVRGTIVSDRSIELSDGVSFRSHRRRIAQIVEIDTGDRRVVLGNTHLASHELKSERTDQARKFRECLETVGPGKDWIVTGDLNDHDEPEVIETISGGRLLDAWPLLHGDDAGWTCPTASPTMRLDHVLVPLSATVLNAGVVQTDPSLSDHLPVVIDVQM